MKLRETPYILRIHASKKKQGHEEYYAELLLYCPFRNELNDLSTDENICLNLFLSNFEILKENRQKLFPFSNEIDEMKILLESSESTRPEHIFDTLDSLILYPTKKADMFIITLEFFDVNFVLIIKLLLVSDL